MSRFRCTVHCDHVNRNHVHCNKYGTIDFDDPDNLIDILEDRGWTIEDDKTICPDHE